MHACRADDPRTTMQLLEENQTRLTEVTAQMSERQQQMVRPSFPASLRCGLVLIPNILLSCYPGPFVAALAFLYWHDAQALLLTCQPTILLHRRASLRARSLLCRGSYLSLGGPVMAQMLRAWRHITLC